MVQILNMGLAVDLLAYGTLFLNIALIASLIVFTLEKLTYFSVYEKLRIDVINRYFKDYTDELVFLQASVATAGSLYMSNFLGWTPCRLCWFQRIIIYPIVILALVSILLRKEDLRDYVMPLLFVGIPIAAYHSLHQRFQQFGAAGCSVTDISCATEYTFHFGYITIPVMALTAMLVMLFLLWRYEEN